MKCKRTLFLFCLFFIFGLASLAVRAEDALPPASLVDWLDYALKRFPPIDCPHLESGKTKCAAITQLSLDGDLKSGQVLARFTGYNWSRTEQTVSLLGPSSVFSLHDSSITLTEQLDPESTDEVFIAPFFDETAGFWKIKVPPGKFVLSTTVRFMTRPVLPMNLIEGIGSISTQALLGGYMQFDTNTGNHGGEVQFILDGTKQKAEEVPLVRVSRVFYWGAIPTFKYVVTVTGLQSEAPIQVRLLADEIIEKTSPEKTFNIVEKNGVSYFETTFSPSNTELAVHGHYKTVPEGFALGDDLPFEIWLHVSDRRYPVSIDFDATPVDPSEFVNLADIDNARAFMVKPSQKLSFQSVNLKTDEGRKGKGKIEYNLFQGARGFWQEKLFLTAQISRQDRLVISTPSAPTYAGIGSEGIELFHDENQKLSVRLPVEGLGEDQPIEVDWNQSRPEFLFFDTFQTTLPGQNVYLEESEAQVFFKPGIVPLYAWGGTLTKGDLVDQFHLYGFLIGILAFFICRGLKFNVVLSSVVTLLFVGLYLSEDFPTTRLIVLLILTLPFVRLKDDAFAKLKTMPIRRRLVMMVWLVGFVVTAVPLAEYARDRVFEAVYPYADKDVVSVAQGYGQQDDEFLMKKSKSPRTAVKKIYEEMPVVGAYDQAAEYAPYPVESKVNMPVQQMQFESNQMLRQKLGNWNAKPVSLDVYQSGGRSVKFTSYNIAQGQETRISVLLAGPLVRGSWMIVETVLILWMMASVVSRMRRLFGVGDHESVGCDNF